MVPAAQFSPGEATPWQLWGRVQSACLHCREQRCPRRGGCEPLWQTSPAHVKLGRPRPWAGWGTRAGRSPSCCPVPKPWCLSSEPTGTSRSPPPACVLRCPHSMPEPTRGTAAALPLLAGCRGLAFPTPHRLQILQRARELTLLLGRMVSGSPAPKVKLLHLEFTRHPKV